MDLKSVEEIIDFAISEEQAAADFYTELSGKMDKKWMSEVLQGFAREELGHKAKLEKIKEGKYFLNNTDKKVIDLKIGDYLVADEASPDLDYQGALIIAMKKEKAAFRLYSDLAEVAGSDELKQSFLALAQEEAKHKLRFEVEYDEMILQEN